MSNTVKDMDASALEAFASQLRGEVVLPQDSNYNDTRKVYNAMIDKNPGMVVKCVVNIDQSHRDPSTISAKALKRPRPRQ